MDRNFDYIIRLYRRIVALRKESVDRNPSMLSRIQIFLGSLSARRAWIEITQDWGVPGRALVALRKESVDRNALSLLIYHLKFGRSPQGERG